MYVGHVKKRKFDFRRRYDHVIRHLLQLVLIAGLVVGLMHQVLGECGFLQVALCSTFASIKLAPWSATVNHHVVSAVTINRALELLEVSR